MATATIVPNGAETSKHAVVFGLFPGDSTFYTVVERAPEVGGAPGTPVKIAWLKPGVRYFIEQRNPTTTFSYYRFIHAGFGYNFGTPSEWFRARPVPWNGEIPNIPREPPLDMDLALDDADGTTDIVVNGGRQVASIEWDFSTSSFPTDPTTTVNTDAEGDVTVTDAFTLTRGQTGYVTVQFFDQVSGGGNLLGTLRQSVARGADTGTDNLTVPTVTEDISYDGAGNATLTLTISDPDALLVSVEFQEKTGSLGSWSGFAADAAPYARTVALSEKHATHVAYRITYSDPTGGGGANESFVETVTIDLDELPEISSIGAESDDAGNVELAYSGDDDVASIRYATSTSAYPTLTTTQSGTTNDGRSDEIAVGSITEGQTLFISVLAYTAITGGGTESTILYRTKATYRTDTDTEPDPETFRAGVLNGDFEHATDGAYWEAADNDVVVSIESGASVITGTKSLKIVTGTAGGTSMRNTAKPAGFTNQAVADWNLIPVDAGDKVRVSCSGSSAAGEHIGIKVDKRTGDLTANGKHTFFIAPVDGSSKIAGWVVPDDGTRFITPLIEFTATASVETHYIDNIGLLIIPKDDRLQDHTGGISRVSGRINEDGFLKNLPKNFITVGNLEDGDSVNFTDFDFDAPPKYAVAKYGLTYEPDATNWVVGTFDSAKAQRMLVDLVDVSDVGATVRAVLQQPPAQTTETTAGSGFETGSEDPMTAVGHNQRKAINNLPATNDSFTVKFRISATGGGDGGGSGSGTFQWEVEVVSIGSDTVRATHVFLLIISGTATTTDTASVDITASDMLVDLADDIEIRVKSGPTFVEGNTKQIISSWEIDAFEFAVDGDYFVTHQFAADPAEAPATDASIGAVVGFRVWDEA